jgi:hypothetical protein
MSFCPKTPLNEDPTLANEFITTGTNLIIRNAKTIKIMIIPIMNRILPIKLDLFDSAIILDIIKKIDFVNSYFKYCHK